MSPAAISFTPIRVGTMSLDHRLVVPPHSGGGGSLLGSPEMFEKHCGYWLARVRGGVQWVGGGPTFVANPLIPGFEPTGVGANGPGVFRHPRFVERTAQYMDRLHAAGGFGSVQMVLQGGMPSAPSATLSGSAEHRVPHALNFDEVAWLIREYGESGALAADGGADAIELHANHDDLLQWFLSPKTNHRSDGYGGSFDNRRRFLREVVESIREHIARPITVGLRLNLDEMIPGGYGLDVCQQLLAAFTADGTVDYFSMDIGDNWGAVSYIPAGFYEEAQWAPLCGQAKEATDLPVIYVGRVAKPATAERILQEGLADLVGFARATIADPELVIKAREGRVETIRPCIGANDCIDRRVVEGLEFACSANPSSGREWEAPTSTTDDPKRVLVVGGGPAGLEFAALMAERGHSVDVWEASAQLGGQLATAALARMNARFAEWITWQSARLAALGVTVTMGRHAAADAVVAAGADLVVVATGATPRMPDVALASNGLVISAAESLNGAAIGRRVVVISQDDRAAPLAVADHLAGLGHDVTLVFETNAPSPLVGKYTIGAVLARLDNAGVRLVASSRLVAADSGNVTLAHVYSGREFTVEADTVVLACGAVADDSLFNEVRGRHPNVHVVGDAFAPRRMVFATRQAWELARQIG